MSRVILELPDDVAQVLRVPEEAIGQELRLAAAMKLFEIGRLSSGAAAELAGIPKPLFLSKLSSYGIEALDHSSEEVEEDLAAAVRHSRQREKPRR